MGARFWGMPSSGWLSEPICKEARPRCFGDLPRRSGQMRSEMINDATTFNTLDVVLIRDGTAVRALDVIQVCPVVGCGASSARLARLKIESTIRSRG
jgi:hypothetical protein